MSHWICKIVETGIIANYLNELEDSHVIDEIHFLCNNLEHILVLARISHDSVGFPFDKEIDIGKAWSQMVGVASPQFEADDD